MKAFLLTVMFLMTNPAAAQELKPYSEPFPDDNFEVFMDGIMAVRNVYELEARGLTQGAVSVEPWSGSYWPIHKGLLSYRYADSRNPNTSKFEENFDFFAQNPPDQYLAESVIEKMSPAEKYDLLIGDRSWTLTNAMWNRGLSEINAGRGVATWTGICHGWAAATHMGVTAPVHAVTVPDVTNTFQIKFYPHDIKGLISYLWAESSPNAIRAGNRCRQSEVVEDQYLRPVEPSCLDANPMSWHLAITNRMGQGKRSFVMDANWGTEVWNYGVSGYDYSYFNPRTMESLHSLKRAIEPIANLTADRFATYRSPRAKYVVGIIMDVFHPALVNPNTEDKNIVSYQVHKFFYDLELDENYQVIGGEWYSAERPDFMWSFPAGSYAQSREDHDLSAISWNPSQPLSIPYVERALQASKREKLLMRIVEPLLRESQR